MNAESEKLWTKIEFQPSDLVINAQIKNQDVEVIMSPYDIPQFMCSYDRDSWRSFEFRYIANDEDKIGVPLGNIARCTVGASSGRLYCLSVNQSALPPKSENDANPVLNWAEVDHIIRDLTQKHKEKEPSYLWQAHW